MTDEELYSEYQMLIEEFRDRNREIRELESENKYLAFWTGLLLVYGVFVTGMLFVV